MLLTSMLLMKQISSTLTDWGFFNCSESRVKFNVAFKNLQSQDLRTKHCNVLLQSDQILPA